MKLEHSKRDIEHPLVYDPEHDRHNTLLESTPTPPGSYICNEFEDK